MKEIVYYCDHCGVELNPEDDYIERECDVFNYFATVDLCRECHDKLEKMVGDFCEAIAKKLCEDALKKKDKK